MVIADQSPFIIHQSLFIYSSSKEVSLSPPQSGHLAVIASVKTGEINVVGLSGAGHLVAAAVAQSKGAVAHAAIDTAGFRFADLKDVYDIDFIPGAAKYDDLPGLLALAAPAQMWLAGEGKEAPPIVKAAFSTTGKAENLTTFSGASGDAPKQAVEWLLNQ